MKFFDKLAERFGDNKKQTNSKEKTWKPWSSFPEENYPQSILKEVPPKWNEEDYLKEARGWVGSCVSVIADEVASMDLRLYQVSNSGKVEEIYEHEILDSLYKVNNFTTKFDHFWLTQQYLELVGEAPWFVEFENTGGADEGGEEDIEDAKMEHKGIKSIHLLRPDKLTIKFNDSQENEQVISGYDYEVSPNNKVHLEPSEVIFLKYPNPYRPLRGMGTLESAAQTVDLENYAERWNLNFFYNSARPDMILSTEGVLNDQQIERIKEQWNKNFRGVGNAFKMAILEGGLKADKIQPTQKDMDFLEQMRFSRDKIMALFRVPKTALGLTEDVNRANAEATDYVFAKRTIKPKMRRIVDQLNEFLVPLYGENLFLDFVDPVPEDHDLKLKEYEKALQCGWMSVNEVRDREGLPPVQNGDAPTIPGNVMPLGEPKKQGKGIQLGKPDKNKKKEIEEKKRKENIIPYKARVRSRKKAEIETKDQLKKIVKMHLKKRKANGIKQKSTKKGSTDEQKRSTKDNKKRTDKK